MRVRIQNTAFVVILISIYAFTFNSVIGFYDSIIVDKILSQITVSYFTVFVLYLLINATIILTIFSLIYNVYVKKELAYISFVLFLHYIGFRFFTNHYIYKAHPSFKNIFYADYFIVLFVCIIVIFLNNKFGKKISPLNFSNPFIVDKVWEEGDDDLLGRKKIAQKLSEKIQAKLESVNAGSLAIGINGKWGSGKTSFLNMIAKFIEKENRVVIYFNPWRSNTPEKIIEDFFEELISAIKEFDSALSKDLVSYSNKLIEIHNNSLINAVNAIATFYQNENPQSIYYKKVNESLSRIQKQVIIFIDDLDRLDKKEIVEVLRLIRNTANFNNLVYIVSYDKNYVLEAIKSINESNHQNFLEKIFQFEFQLPLYDAAINRDNIKRHLKSNLDTAIHSQINWVVDSYVDNINITNEIIKTPRDVIRFINSFLFEYSNIQAHVYFPDFYTLNLLKLRYPQIYEDIYRKKENFFEPHVANFITFYKLKNSINDELDKYKEIGVNEDEVLIINKILKSLVHQTEYIYENQYLAEKITNRFIFPENFSKYFTLLSLESDLTDYEFDEIRKGDFEFYKEKILSFENENKMSQFLDKLNRIDFFFDKTEFENHISILFLLGEKNQNDWEKTLLFNYEHFFKLLDYQSRWFFGSFEIYNNSNEFKEFLIRLFKKATFPYLFASSLLNRAIKNHSLTINHYNDEFKNILLFYLKDYSDRTTDLDGNFWSLYRNCSINDNINIGSNLLKDVYRHKIKIKDLGDLIRQINPNVHNYRLSKDGVLSGFDSIEEFKNWIKTLLAETQEEKDILKEFNEFLALLDENFSADYHFKYLQPVRWLSTTMSQKDM